MLKRFDRLIFLKGVPFSGMKWYSFLYRYMALVVGGLLWVSPFQCVFLPTTGTVSSWWHPFA